MWIFFKDILAAVGFVAIVTAIGGFALFLIFDKPFGR